MGSSITAPVSDEELGPRGVLTGEVDPDDATAAFPKMRLADEEVQASLASERSDFDAHKHRGTGQHGPKLGGVIPETVTDADPAGRRADSWEPGAWDTPKLQPGSVTGAATHDGAITPPKIEDGSLTKLRLGSPGVVVLNGNKQNYQWSHKLGRPVFGQVEGYNGTKHYGDGLDDDTEDPRWRAAEVSVVGSDDNTVTFSIPEPPVTFAFRYR